MIGPILGAESQKIIQYTNRLPNIAFSTCNIGVEMQATGAMLQSNQLNRNNHVINLKTKHHNYRILQTIPPKIFLGAEG